eukprot:5588432-Pyramimonas_sp.AAC.1
MSQHLRTWKAAPLGKGGSRVRAAHARLQEPAAAPITERGALSRSDSLACSARALVLSVRSIFQDFLSNSPGPFGIRRVSGPGGSPSLDRSQNRLHSCTGEGGGSSPTSGRSLATSASLEAPTPEA